MAHAPQPTHDSALKKILGGYILPVILAIGVVELRLEGYTYGPSWTLIAALIAIVGLTTDYRHSTAAYRLVWNRAAAR
jgi:hypothetical protein